MHPLPYLSILPIANAVDADIDLPTKAHFSFRAATYYESRGRSDICLSLACRYVYTVAISNTFCKSRSLLSTWFIEISEWKCYIHRKTGDLY